MAYLYWYDPLGLDRLRAGTELCQYYPDGPVRRNLLLSEAGCPRHHDDLVMSLALAVHAYKFLMDTTPVEFLSSDRTEEKPLEPSMNYKHSFKTSYGGVSKEDFTWLTK